MGLLSGIFGHASEVNVEELEQELKKDKNIHQVYQVLGGYALD